MVLAVAGCRKSAEATVDAGVAAAPLKAAAPKPGPAVPTGPATLSLLEPTTGRCAWRAHDVTADAGVDVATFPGDCVGARVAWSRDLKKALVWFDPEHVLMARYSAASASAPAHADETVDEAARPRAFTVDLSTGAQAVLPMPPLTPSQSLSELAMGPDGAPLAFLLERLTDEEATAQRATRDGQTYDFSDINEGLPGLAVALRWADGAWKRSETAVTTTDWDYAMGVRALKAFDTLGPRSAELAAPHAPSDEVDPDEAAALAPLSPKKAGPDDGQWVRVQVEGARLYAWQVTAEFAYTTGLLALGNPPKPLAGVGFTDGELVGLQSRGGFLLVTASDVGMHPRLYAMPGGALRYASDTARAVTFWPRPTKPRVAP